MKFYINIISLFRIEYEAYKQEPQEKTTRGDSNEVSTCMTTTLMKYCEKNQGKDFVSIVTKAKPNNKAALKIYNEFSNLCVQHVVGKIKMSWLGKNRDVGKRKEYKDLVTITDEAFALLILEDRWELWTRIYEERKKRSQGGDLEHDALTGDEDDMREYVDNEKKIKRNGSNLTLYSYHGKHAPNFKGFDPDVAAKRQNEIYREIKKFRSNDNGQNVMKLVGKYYGEVIGQGPIRDKEKKRKSELEADEVEEELNDF